MVNPLSGKILLVTGGTGFIGRILVSRLQEIPGATVVVLSRTGRPNSCEGLVWVTAALDQLTRQTWLDYGIEKIDFVFHLGAYTPKKQGEANEIDEIYKGNLLGTRALLESLPSVPSKFLFSSTLDVYSRLHQDQTLTEDSRLEPASLYGASKMFCEKLVRLHADKYGYGCAILRFGHIYGPGEDAYSKLIPQTIRAMLKGEHPIIFGDGSIRRDFMFVGDAVEATIRAARSPDHEVGPINIVSGKSQSVREVVDIIFSVSGSVAAPKYREAAAGGTSLEFSADRMFDVLGTWSLCTLESGLRQELDYFRGISND